MNHLQRAVTAPATPPVAQQLPGVTRSAGTSWRYPADLGSRDLRIDFLRGLAIVFVVVDHIHLESLFYIISHERIGAISGAELFVLLSGVVLGMVHQRRIQKSGWLDSAQRMWSRARLLYVVSLVVVFAAYLLSKVPFLDGEVLTTWTDATTGQTYSMYGSTAELAEMPVPPAAVRDVLFLNVGPYQFNVMGLYVGLLLLAPFAMWLLTRGRWWVLMGVSLAIYVMNFFLEWRVAASSFENPFPLLSWQLPFMAGLTIGYYQDQIRQWFAGPAGKTAAVLAWAAFIVFLFFTWNSPGKLGDPLSLRLDLIPDATFWSIYREGFLRDFLGPLRVLNLVVAVIALYGLLTRFWTPAYRLLGWFLVPLGGATLYVFILHVVFALIVSSLPINEHDSLVVGTMTHVVILALLWLMVKSSFLFRWIPR